MTTALQMIEHVYQTQRDGTFPGLAPEEDPVPIMWYKQGEEIKLFAIAVDGGGEMICKVIDGIREQMGPADSIALASAAWMIKRKDVTYRQDERPSEAADRIEIMSYLCVDTTGKAWGQAPIERSASAPTLGELQAHAQDSGMQTQGRLEDALLRAVR